MADWPNWPSFAPDEIEAVGNVLASGQVNYWTGREGRDFEREFAQYIGAAQAIAVANGSLALGFALESLGLEAGSEVVVTPRTFVASVSEISRAGGIPIFAEVNPDSQNITAASIEPLLSERTAAIVVVHLAGWPCDMQAIMDLAAVSGVPVIEDCAQAHGAAISGRKVGNWGDIAGFSFCQDKIMSTGGEGGMIVTSNDELAKYCWSLKDHGKSKNLMETPSTGPSFAMVHDSVGTNGRLTEMQAAIGRCQLRKLDDWVARRRRNAAIFADRLSQCSALRIPVPPGDVFHSYYKFYAFVRPEGLRESWSRDRILGELAAAGVPCSSGICPEVYLEKAFVELRSRITRRLPVAQLLGETSLMFQVHPTLNDAHIERIAEASIDVLSKAMR